VGDSKLISQITQEEIPDSISDALEVRFRRQGEFTSLDVNCWSGHVNLMSELLRTNKS
jgi:hypothetical protein